jgi:hypothetical protein
MQDGPLQALPLLRDLQARGDNRYSPSRKCPRAFRVAIPVISCVPDEVPLVTHNPISPAVFAAAKSTSLLKTAKYGSEEGKKSEELAPTIPVISWVPDQVPSVIHKFAPNLAENRTHSNCLSINPGANLSRRTGIPASVSGLQDTDVSEMLKHLYHDHQDARRWLVRGKTIVNSVNTPGSVATSIVPRCCFTIMSWVIERPSPVPSPAGLVVKNGLNIFSLTSSPRSAL